MAAAPFSNPATSRALTYRDLPPDLQAHYRSVYAAVLVHKDERWLDGRDHDRADANAWEAVRLTNGGELPAAPERDVVAEGVEIARAKLERDLCDIARTIEVGPVRLMAAIEALDAFEAQHGRRP